MSRPLFQRRHYKFLAEHIREENYNCIYLDYGYDTVERLATQLKADNPAFDINRFLRNCGFATFTGER